MADTTPRWPRSESAPAGEPRDQAAARTLEDLRAAVSRIEDGSADAHGNRMVAGVRRLSTAGASKQPAGKPRRDPPPSDPAQAADADPEAVARAVVLRQLAGSPKSRKQLEDALTRKDCPAEVAARVLDRFEEVGLVDDEAYAQSFVRSKQASRGLATRALAHELRAKGVDDEVAQGVLDEVDPEQERARAHGLVAKKVPSMHGLDRAKQTRRLAGMLARKGYGPEVARLVITEVLDAAEEHQRD